MPQTKFPIIELKNGQLLLNVKMFPESLRQPGRSNKDQALEAAESIEHLINMVEKMKTSLLQARNLLQLDDATHNAGASITKLLQELGLE